MASNPKSVISFTRRFVGPGKSWHSGRGAVEMDYSIEPDEVYKRLMAMVHKHSELINIVDDYTDVPANGTLRIEFIPFKGDEYYRTVYFYKKTGDLRVGMC